jgi:hypothetical protein
VQAIGLDTGCVYRGRLTKCFLQEIGWWALAVRDVNTSSITASTMAAGIETTIL